MEVEILDTQTAVGVDVTDSTQPEQETIYIVEEFMINVYNQDRLKQVIEPDYNMDCIQLPPLSRQVAREREQTELLVRCRQVGHNLQTVADGERMRAQPKIRKSVKDMGVRAGIKLTELYEPVKEVLIGLLEKEKQVDIFTITTVLLFGYELSRHLVAEQLGDYIWDLAKILARFIHKEKIIAAGAYAGKTLADWVEGNGGWLQMSCALSGGVAVASLNPLSVVRRIPLDVAAVFVTVNAAAVLFLWLRKR